MANGARAMAPGKIAREMVRAMTAILKRRSVSFTKKAPKTEEKGRSQASQRLGPENQRKL